MTSPDPHLAKLPQSDLRQGQRAGGFIRATPLGRLSPPWSPPPAPQPSLRRGLGSEREGRVGRRTFSKNIKKKTSPLAASAREVERASSGLPVRPPPAAARVSPQPPLGRRRPPGRGRRPSVRPSIHPVDLSASPSPTSFPGLRAGSAGRKRAGVGQGARSPRSPRPRPGGGASTTRSRAVRGSGAPLSPPRAASRVVASAATCGILPRRL